MYTKYTKGAGWFAKLFLQLVAALFIGGVVADDG